MIETILRKFLLDTLQECPEVRLEEPADPPAEMIILERTAGGSEGPGIYSATFAIKSYSGSMLGAAALNEKVKDAMERLPELDQIARCSLNSDYNFTDTKSKRYRYQAVFDILYY